LTGNVEFGSSSSDVDPSDCRYDIVECIDDQNLLGFGSDYVFFEDRVQVEDGEVEYIAEDCRIDVVCSDGTVAFSVFGFEEPTFWQRRTDGSGCEWCHEIIICNFIGAFNYDMLPDEEQIEKRLKELTERTTVKPIDNPDCNEECNSIYFCDVDGDGKYSDMDDVYYGEYCGPKLLDDFGIPDCPDVLGDTDYCDESDLQLRSEWHFTIDLQGELVGTLKTIDFDTAYLLSMLHVIQPSSDNISTSKKTDQEDFLVYPNPSTDAITISCTSCRDGNYLYTIIDILGSRIASGTLRIQDKRSSESIDVYDLASGQHVLLLNTNTSRYALPFIKF
jgi:hypothetical protein